ncbi:phage major capsid protein [Amycolatopsis thermoflava]|uniref:phage major capsid protein n=1 Tax=Amycolatopsis thermoflava TaxID=84480 RepID=UPI0037F34A90
MAQTTSADLEPIIPEVWADMLEADIPNAIRFAPLANVDTRLEGQPGDSIKYPWWQYIGDAADIAETDVIVPTKMDTDEESMTIKEAAKGVELTDRARLYPVGNPEREARRQLTQGVAQKIDNDLVAVAASPGNGLVTVGGATPVPFTVDNMLDGIAAFGELDEGEWSDAFAGVVISPKEQIEVMKDERVQTGDKAGANATLFNGAIGSLWGVPILVSNRVASTGALLIRRNSLILAYKRRPIVETDRDILARSNVITTNVHYGVFRPNRRKGVAKFAPQA